MGIRKNVLKDKSFAFAIRIVRLRRYLQEKQEFDISRQLLRSGTAIGALIREAEFAESVADFIHKMSIAQKEANESQYWLDLLVSTDYIERDAYESIRSDIDELIKLLTSSIKTAKANGEWRKK
jgi:four helix bundle protein